MNVADELARELDRQLQEATSKIEAFVNSQTASLTKAQHDHEQLMRDMEAKIQRLKMEEADAASKHSKVTAQYTTDRKILADKQAEIIALEKTKGTLPAEVEANKVKEEAVLQQLNQTKADYERQEAEVRSRLQELTKGLEYHKRLGLSFEKIDADALRVVFTLLDPKDPARRFTFSLHTDAKDAYAVNDCQPPVPDLTNMVKELNETADISRFVQLMRRQFKKLLQ